MKINKLNYENFVIDYIEGTLSVDLKKDFDLFLENNKEVYDEIKDYMSAPILEEPEVVFEDKKMLTKRTHSYRYALLAFLPIILEGIYFLSSNNKEIIPKATPIVKTVDKPVKSKAEELPQKALVKKSDKKIQIKKQEIKSKNIEEKKVEKEEKSKVTPQLNKENFDIKKISQPSIQEMNFASVEQRVETKNIDAPKRNLINNPSQIGSLEMNFDMDKQVRPTTNMAFAKVETFNGSDENKKSNKSWIEMFTPEAFDDINLKESLAIQINEDVNSTRKILNAFIPESLVK